MDIMLELQENIIGENFYGLLDLCFEVSTYFSFIANPIKEYRESKNHTNFLKKLEPFYIKSKIVNHWHRHYYLTKENARTVYLFRADEKAKEIIRNEFDNLFLNKLINGRYNLADLPEDLCFFINNKMFLGTVSHADIATAYPFNDEICEALLKLGKWEVVEYSDKEQIILDL